MSRPFVLMTLCVVVTACTSSVPRLRAPDRVDVFCGDRATVATAIESIVASTGGAASDRTAGPSAERIKALVKADGGIIAHWTDQPLYAPGLAKSLGISGDYVTLGDAAISNRPTTTDTRPIFLTVKTSAGPKIFALRAYDVQDVCNQGKLSS